MQPKKINIIFLKAILSPLNGVNTLVENQLTVSVQAYFWSLRFVPHIYMSVPVAHCFRYWSFVVFF